jgi:hypothetical protein
LLLPRRGPVDDRASVKVAGPIHDGCGFAPGGRVHDGLEVVAVDGFPLEQQVDDLTENWQMSSRKSERNLTTRRSWSPWLEA